MQLPYLGSFRPVANIINDLLLVLLMRLLCLYAPKEDPHLYGQNVRKLLSACR
jgi:hypothetical protein